MRVLLINMPFAALDSASLALGLFKARLRQEGFPCDVLHLNFDFAEMIGYENYEFMLRLPAIMGGEQLFARPVFGPWLPADSEYYREIAESGSAGPDVPPRLEQIRQYVPAYLQACIERLPWHAYDLIGFTSLFEQNLASLALARLVKSRYPEKTIVFGGANAEQVMGVTLLKCFPFVDFVCSGEADESFPELVRRLKFGHSVAGIPGLVHRRNGEAVMENSAPLMVDLDSTPIPDYDEYFERLQSSSLRPWIRPSLLMESARGCWWGEKSHCTFCGLNGLTMEFRTKTVERTLDEITRLLGRYGPCIVRFTDNILAPGYFRDLLPEIAKRGLKTDYICEVKANLKKHQVKALAEAGVTVQAGIENLSSHVLRLMGKGSNTLMNIQTLKWCKQYGVMADWNLLYGFPGENPEDYAENLELAKLLTHLDPPTGCGPIRLDRFSPNYNRAAEMGIINVRPFKFYKHIYPFDIGTLGDLVYYFDFDYKNKIDNGGHVPELERAIQEWQKRTGGQLVCDRVNGSVLIRDTRPIASWPEVRVNGIAAKVYEYCDRAQGLPRILEVLSEPGNKEVSREEVQEILDEFVAAKLMVREGNRYLSLAVMQYTSEFERLESEPDAERVSLSRPVLVSLQEIGALV